MSDANEPSYYEIALTNRQVVVAFVVLLSGLLAVFLSGVWVGKNGSQREALAETPERAGIDAGPEELANLEEFKFFDEAQKQEGELQKPDLSGLLREPRRDTTLAQDVGAQGARGPGTPTGAAGSGTADPSAGAARPDPSTPPPAQSAPAQQAQQTRTEPPPTPPPAPSSRPAATSSVPPQTPASVSRPPTPSSDPAPAAGPWVVQVFSTHDEPQARKLLRQLEGDGQPAFLSTVEVGGQIMFRVRVGPFDDPGRAETVSKDLRRQLRLDPWVTEASN